MNLIEALERKKALEETIQDRLESILEHLDRQVILSGILTDIDSLIDQFYTLERLIQKSYESTMVSSTESISDIITYADGLSKKVDALKFLITAALKKEIEDGTRPSIDIDTVLASIKQYEELKSILIKKVKDVCFNTSLSVPAKLSLGLGDHPTKEVS